MFNYIINAPIGELSSVEYAFLVNMAVLAFNWSRLFCYVTCLSFAWGFSKVNLYLILIFFSSELRIKLSVLFLLLLFWLVRFQVSDDSLITFDVSYSNFMHSREDGVKLNIVIIQNHIQSLIILAMRIILRNLEKNFRF